MEEHLKRWLPKNEKLGHKKIMLIDYSVSGESLVSAMAYIEEYYKKSGVNNELKITAIIPPGEDESRIKSALGDIKPDAEYIHLPPELQYQKKLYQQKYDDFAKYGRFLIESNEQIFGPDDINPKYQLLTESLAYQISNDPTLRLALEAVQIKMDTVSD